MMKGTLLLSATTWKIILMKGSSNAASAKATASLLGSLNASCTGGDYASAVIENLTNEHISASGSGWKWEASCPVITAITNPIGSVQFAVIYDGGTSAHVLCYSQLSSAIFTVGVGNTLTIATTNGIFSLV